MQEPGRAIHTIYRLLRPRGVLVFYVPFLTKYHNAPSDFFRYTHNGAAHLLEGAGFRTRDLSIIGTGEVATSWLLGMGAGDLTPAQLADAAIVRRVRQRNNPPSDLYIATGLLGIKSSENKTTAP